LAVRNPQRLTGTTGASVVGSVRSLTFSGTLTISPTDRRFDLTFRAEVNSQYVSITL
jgi:hypothetical protein